MIDALFAHLPSMLREHEVLHYRRLRDATSRRMELNDGDSQLRCWLYEKLYTNHYLIHGGSYRTGLLDFEVCRRTVAQNPFLVERRHLKLYAVPTRECHCFFSQVILSRRELDNHRMLCFPTSPMFAYYSGALKNEEQPISWLPNKTATT